MRSKAFTRSLLAGGAVRCGCAALKAHFDARNKPLTQVAAAWVLQQPGITSAIIGASRPEQLDETLASVSMTLDAEDMAACDAAWFSLSCPRDSAIALR